MYSNCIVQVCEKQREKKQTRSFADKSMTTHKQLQFRRIIKNGFATTSYISITDTIKSKHLSFHHLLKKFNSIHVPQIHKQNLLLNSLWWYNKFYQCTV